MRAITGKKDKGKHAAKANTIGGFETEILAQLENLDSLSAINSMWVQKGIRCGSGYLFRHTILETF